MQQRNDMRVAIPALRLDAMTILSCRQQGEMMQSISSTS